MLDTKIASEGDRCVGCNLDLTGSGTIAIRENRCYCRKCIAAGKIEKKPIYPVRPAVSKP